MAFNDKQIALTSSFRSFNSKVPIFLQKLYKIVDSPETNDAISWSDDGDSFIVYNHERLARDYLPQWFKHNKYPSFVRQLNNYGFHKVPNLQQGVMNASMDVEQSQYAHPYFQRGREDQLILIRPTKQAKDRPTIDFEQGSSSIPSSAGQQLDIHAVLNGITAIRKQQTAITQDLNDLKRSDQLLWEEALQARNRHTKLQDTVNRIVKFLATLITQPSGNGVAHPQPPRMMIEGSTTSKIGEVEEHEGDGTEAEMASTLPKSSIQTPSTADTDTSFFSTSATDSRYPTLTPSSTIDPSMIPRPIPSPPPSPGKLSSAFDSMSASDWDMFSSLLNSSPSHTDFTKFPLFNMGQSPPRLPLTSGDNAQPIVSESLVKDNGSLNKSIRDIDNAVNALDCDIDFLGSALGIPSDGLPNDDDGIDFNAFFNYATPPPDILADVPDHSQQGSLHPDRPLQPDGQDVDPGDCPPKAAGLKRKLDTTDLEAPPIASKPPPSLGLEETLDKWSGWR